MRHVTLNDLAIKLSGERQVDVMEALFERVFMIAMGEKEDPYNSARYCFEIMDRLMETSSLYYFAHHPSMPRHVQTLDDINTISDLLCHQLLSGEISLKLANQMYDILLKKLRIMDHTKITEPLLKLWEELQRLPEGAVIEIPAKNVEE